MEKLKHGSMLLRTEESVRFPGLGERTKIWRNYLLSSISAGVNRLHLHWSHDHSTFSILPERLTQLFSDKRAEMPGHMPAIAKTWDLLFQQGLPSSRCRCMHWYYPAYKDKEGGKKRDYLVWLKVILVLCRYTQEQWVSNHHLTLLGH